MSRALSSSKRVNKARRRSAGGDFIDRSHGEMFCSTVEELIDRKEANTPTSRAPRGTFDKEKRYMHCRVSMRACSLFSISCCALIAAQKIVSRGKRILVTPRTGEFDVEPLFHSSLYDRSLSGSIHFGATRYVGRAK